MTLALLYLLACGAPDPEDAPVSCTNRAGQVGPGGYKRFDCHPTATIETTPVNGGVLVVCRCPVPAVEGM